MKSFICLISIVFLASCHKASEQNQETPNSGFNALAYVYKCEEVAFKIASSLAAIDGRNLDTTLVDRYTKPAVPNKIGELEAMEQFDWKSWKDNSCQTLSVVIMQNSVTGACNYNNSGASVDCN